MATRMALLDTNVLVHAIYRGSKLHDPAARLVARGLRERGVFCVAPQNLVEFVAVVTRARFVDPPISASEAVQKAEVLYGSRRLHKIYPARGTVRRMLEGGRDLGIAGTGWYDLFLIATMRDAGIRTIVSEDRGPFSESGLDVKRIADAV